MPGNSSCRLLEGRPADWRAGSSGWHSRLLEALDKSEGESLQLVGSV